MINRSVFYTSWQPKQKKSLFYTNTKLTFSQVCHVKDCMNIDRQKSHQKHNLRLLDYPDLVHGLTVGFTSKIPDHQEPFDQRNSSRFATKQEDDIENIILQIQERTTEMSHEWYEARDTQLVRGRSAREGYLIYEARVWLWHQLLILDPRPTKYEIVFNTQIPSITLQNSATQKRRDETQFVRKLFMWTLSSTSAVVDWLCSRRFAECHEFVDNSWETEDKSAHLWWNVDI